MRPIWRGNLEISLVTIPVQMHTAHTSRKEMKFDLLHKQCKAKIIEQFFCPACEMAVGGNELGNGFKNEKGDYILVSDEDLQAAHKEAIGTIEVIRFVDGALVNPIYYCHAHYLTPRRGKNAIEAFALFRQAMVEEEKIALAKVVIRNKEHMLAIRPHDWTLAAYTLHYPEEIRNTQEIEEAEKVQAAKIDKQNLILAKSLIRKTTGGFVPEEFSGGYTKTLMEIIQAKAGNGQIRAVPKKATERVMSLEDALEKSIARTTRGQAKIPQPDKRGARKKAM